MHNTLRYIYLAVLILLTLYSLLSLRGISRAGAKLLVVVLVLTCLIEVVGTTARFLNIGNKITLGYNLYTLAVVPLYLYTLKDSLSAAAQKAIPYVVLVFVALGLGNLFFLQGVDHFNHFTLMLGAALLVFFSLLYFKSRFDHPHENLLSSWRFWVATGLLMYFPGTLLYFGFMPHLSQFDHSWLALVNIILQLMNIMLYSLFGVALLCLRPRQI